MMVRQLAAIMLVAGFLVGCSHALHPGAGNPGAMGKRSLPVSGPAFDDAALAAALGALADQLFLMERRPYPDSELTRYVARVGERVAAVAGAGRFEFDVVDDTEVNAWSIPGGRVHISRAALAVLDSEAQLAAVLGHEVGHSMAGHAAQSFLVSLLEPDTDRADASLMEREQEYQADRLGSRWLRAAGYDPRAAPSMLERLAAAAGEPCAQAPPLATRLARLWRHVGSLPRGRVERDAYLDRIDGLVYGEDPRTGIVRGSWWLCERCGFGLQAPSGWSIEQQDGACTARGSKGDEGWTLRRVGDSRGMFAASYAGLIQSKPFVQQELAGMRVLAGAIESKGATAAAALIYAGADAFILVASGEKAERRLAEVLGTLRPVSAGDVPSPPRVRVRRAAGVGEFQSISRQTCGAFASADKLSILNGRATTDRVEAGERIKCVEPG